MAQSRRDQAYDVRVAAAELAKGRVHPAHKNNGEEHEYRREDGKPSHFANFTKGLPHDEETGLVKNPHDYQQFVLGIQSGDPKDFAKTPLGPADNTSTRRPECLSEEAITCETSAADRAMIWKSDIAQNVKPGEGADLRAWESAGAGLLFSMEGPDAQAVTMPLAPRLDSEELAAEIAAVYAMALLRDVSFNTFPLSGRSARPATGLVQDALNMLNELPWFGGTLGGRKPSLDCCDLSPEEIARRQPRLDVSGSYPGHKLFRGMAKGDDVGPYLSQFLLIGSDQNDTKGFGPEARTAGRIHYGAITIEQKVRVATGYKDYMTTWNQWLDVQHGADVMSRQSYRDQEMPPPPPEQHRRFIATPRDLATYVHVDALYEAYLNACLILLGMGAPFDPGVPFQAKDVADKQQGFAHFGGPQILSLVCEVATRALKAVRYQKYNVHRRLRPEALGGRLHYWFSNAPSPGVEFEPMRELAECFNQLRWGRRRFRNMIRGHNRTNNRMHFSEESDHTTDSYLLPMAFPEGSPMHPSYGAGHATVAGACVTILKAFFDHGWELPLRNGSTPIAYEPNTDGSDLESVNLAKPLTVEGELNKLAANISIARNWAGVHYFTDYIESLRMGEKIAIGILEEQKLTYGENFTMTVPLFDGGAVRI